MIAAGKEAEAKTAASLSKLQMMSKSQTAILRANFTKKIAMKDVLLDEVLAALAIRGPPKDITSGEENPAYAVSFLT